jgi:hypothetical protein
MVGSLILFYVAMSTFTEVGVGSFVGKGNVDVSIPGEELNVSVLSQWGPGNGFFIYVVSTLILLSFLLVTLYKNKNRKM